MTPSQIERRETLLSELRWSGPLPLTILTFPAINRLDPRL